MILRDLLKDVDFVNPNNINLDVEIVDLATDSRLARSNYLFIARRGSKVDSHQFIDELAKNGVFCLGDKKRCVDIKNPYTIFVEDTGEVLSKIASNFYEYPSYKFDVYGVTGTNGKTSITYLINAIAKEAGKKTGIIGTISTKIADKVLASDYTTPESIYIQKDLSEMNKAGVDICAMEVSSIGLEQKRSELIDFSVAIFTNFTQDHLDYHGSMEKYFQAKRILFEQIARENKRGQQNFAILNIEDEKSQEFAKVTKAETIFYGYSEEADYRAINIKHTVHATEYDLIIGEKTHHIKLPLIGNFNVLNSLAAIAACHKKGIDMTTIVRAMEHVEAIPGRLERTSAEDEDDITVFVDYAHTPDSIEKACETINDIKIGKLITIVGCGGDRDKSKRPKMAKIACQKSDLAIFTADNPRTENQNNIFSDMLRDLGEDNYKVIPNRKAAIEEAIMLADEDDSILICGKGHEDYQIIGTKKYHFDDREISRHYLKERRFHK